MHSKVIIGADHRGFELKGKLVIWLKKRGYEVEDVGATRLDEDDDYVDYATDVVNRIKNQESRGVVLCGSGVGVDVVANKFKGIRCGLGLNAEQVKAARTDDDINCLALASDFISFSEAADMVAVFLEAEFSGKERYRRRLEKIERLN